MKNPSFIVPKLLDVLEVRTSNTTSLQVHEEERKYHGYSSVFSFSIGYSSRCSIASTTVSGMRKKFSKAIPRFLVNAYPIIELKKSFRTYLDDNRIEIQVFLSFEVYQI